jgi:hypothetical protein
MPRLLVDLMGPSVLHAQERLVAPQLDGFVVGGEAAHATQSIREEVPAGESVTN